MPQDPDLYGQRPPKRQKKSTSSALPSSLAFKSELASLISTSKTPTSSITPQSTTQARPRPSKSKPNIFATVKAKRKADKASKRTDDKLILKNPTTTEDEKNAHLAARRKMEDKARLYAAMKRGDYVPKEGEAAPLIDFDRKWAEAQEAKDSANDDSSSSDDYDDDDIEDPNEIITFTDEFGRTRSGRRASLQRLERQTRASAYGAAELERMRARPQAPERLIYGDAVQAEAFVPDAAMEAMAAKRDRSLTPPPELHYDANGEIRTKGVGFFQFSRDGGVRKEEMEALARERETTERERGLREEERGVRKREVEERRRVIEERRRAVGEKRAARIADSFLEGLAADMEGAREKDKKKEKEGEVDVM